MQGGGHGAVVVGGAGGTFPTTMIVNVHAPRPRTLGALLSSTLPAFCARNAVLDAVTLDASRTRGCDDLEIRHCPSR